MKIDSAEHIIYLHKQIYSKGFFIGFLNNHNETDTTTKWLRGFTG